MGSMADDFGLSAHRACRPAPLPVSTCLLMIVLMPVQLLAQGSKADYERAMSLSKRTEDLVDRDRVKSHWLAGNNTFWYRVQTGPKQQEVLLVDAVRGTGQAGSEAARFRWT